MWHEARRREKATQKLFNDHKKRAEKRREENRIDPNSLIQVHGTKTILYLDSNLHKQSNNSLVAWQGDKSILIDRFDVRATLTSIPIDSNDSKKSKTRENIKDASKASNQRTTSVLDADEDELMKKLLNFERYRLLINNDLNKVTEETRIKLVARSEYLTDTRVKKLQNNRFGTSGEIGSAKQSSQYLLAKNSSRISHNSRPKPGVSIGYNYGQVSTSPLENDKFIDGNEDDLNDIIRSDSQKIIDLDGFDDEDFDLDRVGKSNLNSKRTNEITAKYGLTDQEFDLLAETNASLNDLLKNLRKLRGKERGKSDVQQVYGPSLPPGMMNNDNSGNDPSNLAVIDDSSDKSSPVQQRSPSGAIIPLRNEDPSYEDIDANPHYDVHEKASTISIKIANPNRTFVESSQKANLPTSVNDNSIDTSQQSQLLTKDLIPKNENQPTSVNGEHNQSSEKEPGNHEPNSTRNDSDSAHPPRSRRASTPLAYKKYQRSNRSISRERRSDQNSLSKLDHNSHHHHQNHDRRSSSSSPKRIKLPFYRSESRSRSPRSSSSYSERWSNPRSPRSRVRSRSRSRDRYSQNSRQERKSYYRDHKPNSRRTREGRRDRKRRRRR